MNLVSNFYRKKITGTKANKVKKIVFSKLWEHATYYKVGNIHLEDKRFGRVFMNQEWGNCEINFQKLKSIISFNFFKKRLILSNQPSKKGHY